MIDPIAYFFILLKASLFSTGGTGNLPSIHADLLARGWANEGIFAEALAIGQISPGPSGLWVVCLGYLTDGLRGALMATVAICLPPMLILPLARVYRRIGEHPAFEGFIRALSLSVSGIFLVVVVDLLVETGINPQSVGLLVASMVLGAMGRFSVPLLLILAGVAGVILYG